MLSEAPRKRPHSDAFYSNTPTASKKRSDEDASPKEKGEYNTKPISQWTREDVVEFFLGGRIVDLDCDFSQINGVVGTELATLTREKFQLISRKRGDRLYEDVRRRVRMEDRESSMRLPHPVSISAPPTTLSAPSKSPLYAPPCILTSPPHNPHHTGICDAQAPYELRFEPLPQPPLQLPRGQGGVGRFPLTPTAALKSVPPPLMALDVGGRKEQRGGGERELGQSSSGGVVEAGQRSLEEVTVEPPKKRGPGRPKKPESELKKKKKKKTGRLWEFIRNLLLNPETCPSLVKWENPEEGLFRFIDGEKVAKRWGDRKQNKDMNYEKLSRAMRYYYKTHVFEAVIGRRLVYKFGRKATGWRPTNPNFPPNSNQPTTPTPSQEPQPITPKPHHHSTPPQIHYVDSPTTTTTTTLPQSNFLHDNFSASQLSLLNNTTASTSQSSPPPHHQHQHHHHHTQPHHHHHHTHSLQGLTMHHPQSHHHHHHHNT